MRRLAILLLLLYAVPAYAGMMKPVELEPYIQSLTPFGEGEYRAYFITAYDAALWTDADTWSMDEPFALLLVYRMHFTSREIVERSLKEMSHEHLLSESQAKIYAAELGKIIPDVKSGDRITAIYMPGKWEDFYYNGKKVGRIQDEVFARKFMDIWLSEKTSAPALRSQLIRESSL